jgi:hypothetical protein
LEPDIIFENAKLPDGRKVNIAVAGGRFTAFEETPIRGTPSSAREDLLGRLVLPNFIDGHIPQILNDKVMGFEWAVTGPLEGPAMSIRPFSMKGSPGEASQTLLVQAKPVRFEAPAF